MMHPQQDQDEPQQLGRQTSAEDRMVVEKQIARWKDDGGALAPEPGPVPTKQ